MKYGAHIISGSIIVRDGLGLYNTNFLIDPKGNIVGKYQSCCIIWSDVQSVIERGHVKKEYKPDRDHPEWRWSLYYDGITIIFNFNLNDGRIVFITCWRGKEPKEGEQ